MNTKLQREAELIREALAAIPPEPAQQVKQMPAAEPKIEFSTMKQLTPKQKLAAIVLALAEQPDIEPIPPMSEAQEARLAGLLKRAKA